MVAEQIPEEQSRCRLPHQNNAMEIGKLPEALLQSIVFGHLGASRPEVICGSGAGEDCAAIRLADNEDIVLSTDPITGTTKDIGHLAVTVNVNDLVSSGAVPIGVMVTILLPPTLDEAALTEIATQIHEVCLASDITVLGGHTEVTSVVNQPVISMTAVGKVKKGALLRTADAKAGMSLIVTKWIGLEGTSIIAKEHALELSKRFPKALIETATSFSHLLSVQKEAELAVACNASAMHDITEGGILGALWEMAQASHLGLSVDLTSIPIRQETIEICEFYNINPYQLLSSGSMLIATAFEKDLLFALTEADIPASVIGTLDEGKERKIFYDGKVQFLTPPKPDALYQVK